jgi:integrase
MATESRLLDRVRDQLRTLHYSYRTEQQYLFWIRRFIVFHGKRHPSGMAAPEVEGFLTHLAVERQVSASTQNQALAAILFLYQKVLQVQLPWLDGIVRAKRSRYLPVVLTTAEVRSILAQLNDEYWLIVNVLYGAGLRVREALQLRVKDVQFDYRQLVVRSGKGGKDRVTILPEALLAPLQKHLESVHARHQAAIHGGYAGVETVRARAQISECSSRVGLAVRLPGAATFPRSKDGRLAAPSRHSRDPATPGEACRQGCGCRQACVLPHLPPLLRDSPARARL